MQAVTCPLRGTLLLFVATVRTKFARELSSRKDSRRVRDKNLAPTITGVEGGGGLSGLRVMYTFAVKTRVYSADGLMS